MKVGERLFYWRTLKKISIYTLSKKSNISENHIRNIENGIKQPTIPTLEAITNAMNISLSEFFNTDKNASPVYLTAGEKEILNLYRKLSKEKSEALSEFLRKITE